MKKLFTSIILLIAVFALLPNVASAQDIYSPVRFANNKIYVNSQLDTSATTTWPGIANLLSLYYYAKDSCAADIYVDVRASNQISGAWTQAYADSLVGTVDAGTVKEIIIRNHTLERATGMGDYRVRTAWRATKNGVTSATYIAEWRWVR